MNASVKDFIVPAPRGSSQSGSGRKFYFFECASESFLLRTCLRQSAYAPFFPGSARKLSSVSKTHALRKKTYYTPFAGLESNHLKI